MPVSDQFPAQQSAWDGSDWNTQIWKLTNWMVNGGSPTFTPAADGVTDDLAKLDTALAATPAGGQFVFPHNKTISISGTWVINKAVTIDLNGCTIKKAAAMATHAVSITAADVTLQNGTVDGNQAAGASGNGIITNALRTVCRNITSKNGKAGSLFGPYTNGELTCFNCTADTSVQVASAGGIGFYATLGAILRTDASCQALNCQQNGWRFDATAADRCELNGYAYRCGGAAITSCGASIANNKGKIGRFVAEDCRSFGVSFESGSTKWHCDYIEATQIGVTDGWNAGTGVQFSGGNGYHKIGTIVAKGCRGYSLAFAAGSSHNSIGTIIGDQQDAGDGDPGITFQGASSYNVIGVAHILNHTYGVVIGEGVANTPTYNTIGTIIADGCSFGALRIDKGTHNHIGRVIGRDTFTTDVTYTCLIDFSTANTDNNIVGFVDNRATGTKPKFVVHFDGACTNNLVLDGISRGDFVTAAVNGSGVGGNLTSPALSAPGALR